MALELFLQDEYKDIIQEHLSNTIHFLLDNDKEFSLAAEVRHIAFDPVLPKDIKDTFEDVILFVMAGFTFESAYITEDSFHFEAGFGTEGIGSKVTIPILAIKQIFADDFPIAINISEPKREKYSQSPDRSMSALLNNPENKKLLKKKR